ncbi:hypothetical protein EDB85DRAFT_2141638 [Lactarius pseudohatsudake]|nr:hypothetical protein EDB85DRAFT_2141638 [Lactarius pseudohatsudake]
MIALNGRIIVQGSQVSLTVVEVISATIDIEVVRAHHAKSSRSMQAAAAECYHRIEAPIALSGSKFDVIEELNRPAARPYEVRYHTGTMRLRRQSRALQNQVNGLGVLMAAVTGALPPSTMLLRELCAAANV